MEDLTRLLSDILFNMFALWMFGNVLENVWGPKRFLNYYLITGIGAGITHLVIAYIRIAFNEYSLSPDQFDLIYNEGYNVLQSGKNYSDPAMGFYNIVMNVPTVGASGAVFGILLAFGMMFPNSLIYVYFAIPVKAKYFVIFYRFVTFTTICYHRIFASFNISSNSPHT